MAGVSAVRWLLANNAALVAMVPAAKIFVGVVPIDTVLPAIAVTQIDGVPMLTVAMTEGGKIQTDRVQVTVLSKTYQTSISAAVLAALQNQAGTVNGTKLDSLLPDAEGPDLFDDTAVIYERSRDFFARWHLP
jgi:hypothetical protein